MTMEAGFVNEFLFITNDLRELLSFPWYSWVCRKSFELVYGISEHFLFAEGHLGINNAIIKGLYMSLFLNDPIRYQEVIQLCSPYLKMGSRVDKSFLTVSFIFCCLNPRDYTILNRRKDAIGNDQKLLHDELKAIRILQGIAFVFASLNRSISQSSGAMGPSSIHP